MSFLIGMENRRSTPTEEDREQKEKTFSKKKEQVKGNWKTAKQSLGSETKIINVKGDRRMNI